MNILVTGGTGFIGQHVVKNIIKHNFDVIVLTRNKYAEQVFKNKKVKLIDVDLSDAVSLKKRLFKFQPDMCIHMAWEGIPDYSCDMSVKNLFNSLNLFTILSETKCKKIICSGSCWEYNQKKGQLDEKITINPKNPFIAAKHSVHLMGKELAREKDMDFIWARFFYVYGPGQKSYSLIPHIINSVSSGKKPEIKTPLSKNDFVYVEDVAEALSMLLKRGKGITSYNIGSGHSTSVKDVVEIVCENYDFDYKISPDRQVNKSSTDFWADISKIKKEIGWIPETSIDKGIERTIEYYYNKINQRVKEAQDYGKI
jgi:nucleoside-diphosphate-sugar epimerase